MKRSKHTNLLRRSGILVLGIVVTLVIVAYSIKRKTADDSSVDLVELLPLKADLTISKVHQTATRNGIKEWRLDAESAQFFNKSRQLVLNTIDMVFFMDNRREVMLSAEKGSVAIGSKDVQVEGNVVVKSDQARLETKRLHYNHEQRLLEGTEPVEVTGKAFYLEADTMTYDLNTNRSVLEGNVKGYFREDLPL